MTLKKTVLLLALLFSCCFGCFISTAGYTKGSSSAQLGYDFSNTTIYTFIYFIAFFFFSNLILRNILKLDNQRALTKKLVYILLILLSAIFSAFFSSLNFPSIINKLSLSLDNTGVIEYKIDLLNEIEADGLKEISNENFIFFYPDSYVESKINVPDNAIKFIKPELGYDKSNTNTASVYDESKPVIADMDLSSTSCKQFLEDLPSYGATLANRKSSYIDEENFEGCYLLQNLKTENIDIIIESTILRSKLVKTKAMNFVISYNNNSTSKSEIELLQKALKKSLIK